MSIKGLVKSLYSNCPGTQVDWREAEAVLKAGLGDLEGRSSPTAASESGWLHPPPHQSTPRPPLWLVWGPWCRGRLDAIWVVEVPSRGEACAQGPPARTRALADTLGFPPSLPLAGSVGSGPRTGCSTSLGLIFLLSQRGCLSLPMGFTGGPPSLGPC